MGKIPDELRDTIARNIRALRVEKFPGRGGGKKCAEAFARHVKTNVSPQQWSPWERGGRTPDEKRMTQIAEFFGVTVSYLREDHTDHRPDESPPPKQGPLPPPNTGGFLPPPGMPSTSGSDTYWLLVKFMAEVGGNGLRVRMSVDDMDYLGQRIAQALAAHGMTVVQGK